jgi:uncharacterized membrane protein
VLDLSFLAPLGTFLGVLGGGAVWLFNRADKQREARESSVIALYKEQNGTLRQQLQAAERESKSRLRDGTKWREQLIEHQIKPDPEEWTDMENQS